MNVSQKLMSLPLTDNGRMRIANALFRKDGETRNIGLREYLKRTKRLNADDYDWDFSNLLEKMSIVNKMVKDTNCPRNRKNRFYTLKHDVISHLYQHGDVLRVYDEGKYYAFKLTDNITFHQPIDRCWFAKPDEVRESTVEDGSIPFDINTYKNCLITMIYFIETYDNSEI